LVNAARLDVDGFRPYRRAPVCVDGAFEYPDAIAEGCETVLPIIVLRTIFIDAAFTP
jgi:hypothetical protein